MSKTNRELFFLRVFALSLVASRVLSADLPAADDNAVYNEVATSLKEWRQSFATLRIVYEVRDVDQEYDGPFDINSSPGADAVVWRYDWVWSEDGKIWCRQERFFDRKRTNESIYGSDGLTGYEAHFNIEENSTLGMRELTLRRERMTNPGMKFGIHPLTGLWSNYSAQWVFEQFQEHGANFVDFSDSEQRFPMFACRTTTYEFDRSFSYLTKSRVPSAGAENPASLLFYVDGFKTLNNGLPFPWTGRLFLGPEYKTRWQVFIAEPNVSLSVNFFAVPKPNEGTVVIDRIKGTEFIVGQKKPTTPAAIAAVARTQQQQNAGKTVVAIVPTSALRRWSIILAGAGLILLVTGLWFKMRETE